MIATRTDREQRMRDMLARALKLSSKADRRVYWRKQKLRRDTARQMIRSLADYEGALIIDAIHGVLEKP